MSRTANYHGAHFEVVEITPERVVIRDIGHAHGRLTVTNDAERVVARVVFLGILPGSRRLFYFDSTERLDEILVRDGKFAGFAPGPQETERASDA